MLGATGSRSTHYATALALILAILRLLLFPSSTESVVLGISPCPLGEPVLPRQPHRAAEPHVPLELLTGAQHASSISLGVFRMHIAMRTSKEG